MFDIITPSVEVKVVRTYVGKNTGAVSDLVVLYYEDNI